MFKKLMTALAILAASLGASPVMAGPLLTTLVPGSYIPNQQVLCVADATAGYTNSTVTPSDITGASCAVPATNDNFANQFIEVCFNADATKSTATTGSIGVFANGALITASKRFATSAAGQSDLSGCYVVARSSGAAQTVKLQGVSGDTNLFTVSNVQFKVSIIQLLV